MATFSYQINVFMEDYGNCSFNFNYNKISNFNDLICSFSTIYPERDICPCSKLYYKSDDNTYKEIYNKNQKFYSLIIRGNQYKIALNKECKCPQVIKDNFKKTKYELLLYLLEKYKNKFESENKIEKSHNVIDEIDSIFISSINKEPLQIQPTESMEILSLEKPNNEIEYVDEINISRVEKGRLQIDNMDYLHIQVVNSLCVKGYQEIKNIIKNKNNIVENIDSIKISSLEKPINKIEHCDTFELVKKEDKLNKTNYINSDIDLKNVDPSFALNNTQNKFMNFGGHCKKNSFIKNNLPRVNEEKDSEEKRNYYRLDNNKNK